MSLSTLIDKLTPGRRTGARMQATYRGVVIARSDDTVVVEGNHYFPRESLDDSLVRASDETSLCPWKGKAAYLDVVVDGETAQGAAWCYPSPLPAARKITGRVAFWRGVTVEPAKD